MGSPWRNYAASGVRASVIDDEEEQRRFYHDPILYELASKIFFTLKHKTDEVTLHCNHMKHRSVAVGLGVFQLCQWHRMPVEMWIKRPDETELSEKTFNANRYAEGGYLRSLCEPEQALYPLQHALTSTQPKFKKLPPADSADGKRPKGHDFEFLWSMLHTGRKKIAVRKNRESESETRFYDIGLARILTVFGETIMSYAGRSEQHPQNSETLSDDITLRIEQALQLAKKRRENPEEEKRTPNHATRVLDQDRNVDIRLYLVDAPRESTELFFAIFRKISLIAPRERSTAVGNMARLLFEERSGEAASINTPLVCRTAECVANYPHVWYALEQAFLLQSDVQSGVFIPKYIASDPISSQFNWALNERISQFRSKLLRNLPFRSILLRKIRATEEEEGYGPILSIR